MQEPIYGTTEALVKRIQYLETRISIVQHRLESGSKSIALENS